MIRVFEEVGTKNYLVFQPVNRYFKVIDNKRYISSWKSKGLSDETTKLPATSDYSLSLSIDYIGYKIRAKFSGSCLKQPKISYTHETIANIHIFYVLSASSSFKDDPTLAKSLFGAVILTKIADIDKYQYSAYGIGFDRKSSFSFPGGAFCQNEIIFGAGMSCSVHVDNKKKHFNYSKRLNTGIRTFTDCRKNVFN